MFKVGDIVRCIGDSHWYTFHPVINKKYKVVRTTYCSIHVEEIPRCKVKEWNGEAVMDFNVKDFVVVPKGPYLSNQGTEINV